MSQNLYARARKIASKAVTLDNDGQKTEAIKYYLQAAEILLELKNFTRNPQLTKTYDSRAREYVDRAKLLKKSTGAKKVPRSSKRADGEGEELDGVLKDAILSESPDISLDDVAGLKDVKQALREAIVLPLMRPDLFTGSRQPWSGILLHGPPGCGKTMIAKATAGDVKATFFNISAATLVSKWMGESEKLVKRLYEIAREKQPSIIFIDEVDSLTQSRGGEGENDSMRRVKTQLLTSIEGMASDKGDRVVTIGATNTPWEIDTAFRRRFQRRIYVSLPDIDARKEIFRINSKGVDLSDNINFTQLAELTEGFSGSDIATICREAIMTPVRELDTGDLISDENIMARPVNHSDYVSALEIVKKSVSNDELRRFRQWDEEFGAG